ncbi:CRACD-like protein isoform X2 [Sorex araneus]|uniref:CRACD-like protein isoform X2 n=1 Tax=Sorex araneus TaxID=42254 RepID=UPI002433E47F|nr:CRACD-like protein isoform X2 [Sorex araneus]
MISTRVMDVKLREAAEGLGEDSTGKKKSKFKTFKKLFGKKKRKESPSSTGGSVWKQSPVKSEVIATGTGPLGYDSEDELEDSRGALGSRALSHDSIFIPESGQDPARPVRVFSQENVCDRIKALQLKIQCNVKMGPPPPGGLPVKRGDDTGMSSEDDGLPRSPPEISLLHEVGPSTTIKVSLAPSPRPPPRLLTPDHLFCRQMSEASVLPRTSRSSLAPVADFDHPPEFSSCLDSSAARHKLLVKPRNQRSSRMRRLSSRAQSESLSYLLDPDEEDYEEKPVLRAGSRAQDRWSGPVSLGALLQAEGPRARRARLQHSPALRVSGDEDSIPGDQPPGSPATPEPPAPHSDPTALQEGTRHPPSEPDAQSQPRSLGSTCPAAGDSGDAAGSRSPPCAREGLWPPTGPEGLEPGVRLERAWKAAPEAPSPRPTRSCLKNRAATPSPRASSTTPAPLEEPSLNSEASPLGPPKSEQAETTLGTPKTEPVETPQGIPKTELVEIPQGTLKIEQMELAQETPKIEQVETPPGTPKTEQVIPKIEQVEIPEVTPKTEQMETSQGALKTEQVELAPETPKIEQVETPPGTLKAEPVEIPQGTPMTEQVETPWGTPKIEQVETPQGAPKTEPVETPQETPKTEQVETSWGTPKTEQAESPQEMPKTEHISTPQGVPKTEQMETPQETLKTEHVLTPQGTHKTEQMEIPQETPKTEYIVTPQETPKTKQMETPQETLKTEHVMTPQGTLKTEQVETPQGAPKTEQVETPQGAPKTEQVETFRETPKIEQVGTTRETPNTEQVETLRETPKTEQVETPCGAPKTEQSETSKTEQAETSKTEQVRSPKTEQAGTPRGAPKTEQAGIRPEVDPVRLQARGPSGSGRLGGRETHEAEPRAPFPVKLRSASVSLRPRDAPRRPSNEGRPERAGPALPLRDSRCVRAGGQRQAGKGRPPEPPAAKPPLPRKPLLQTLTLAAQPSPPDPGPRREPPRRGTEKAPPCAVSGPGTDSQPAPPWITISRQKRRGAQDLPAELEDRPGSRSPRCEAGKQVKEPVKQADFVRSKSFLITPAKPTGDQDRGQGTKIRLQEGLQRGISLSHQNLAQVAMMSEKELHQLKRASYTSTDQPSWMELARKKSQAWSDMPQIIK